LSATEKTQSVCDRRAAILDPGSSPGAELEGVADEILEELDLQVGDSLAVTGHVPAQDHDLLTPG